MNDLPDYGPWARDIDAVERAARARSLGALVKVLAGPSALPLVTALRGAEANDDWLADAAGLFGQLPALSRRRVLASYAALHDPRGPQ